MSMTTATLDLKGRVVLFRMKSEQFANLPDSDNFRLELLDGEVVMATRPRPEHQHFIFQLGIILNAWVRPHRRGIILLDTQMNLDEYWSPVPDLLYLTTAHQGRIGETWIEGPADLVVEVLSPSDEEADRVTKFEAYARFGVPWYWIVDLEQRQLEEYKRGRQHYGRPVIAPFNQPFQPRLFKGVSIDLASLGLEGER
jgi:Uma2 family endonuclease